MTVPANLTQPCPPLQPLADGADFGHLLEAAVDAAGKYRECSTRHEALSRLVRP